MKFTDNAFLIESEIRDLIYRHMGWNQEKVDLWMRTPNPNLGGAAPNDFVRKGRALKVLQFVKGAIELDGDPQKLLSSENSA